MKIRKAQFGYACINMHLQETEKVQCNHGMIKRTFMAKGIEYASHLALSNVKALQRVVEHLRQNHSQVGDLSEHPRQRLDCMPFARIDAFLFIRGEKWIPPDLGEHQLQINVFTAV